MKFDMRLKIVRYAERHGVKPAAREFGSTPKTVRKWLGRWQDSNHARKSLADQSRAPHSCPHKTPARIERQILRERKKAPCLGAERLKDFCAIPASQGAIARVLRQHGLTRRRRKKHEKKRDMRELKARFDPCEENQVDVKYLNDIPYYVEQMWRNPDLPRFEYTWRDVKTGALFLGFANELSETHACCFVVAVAAHLGRTGFELRNFGTIQTDNGSEFSGAERKVRNDRGFTYTVESLIRAHHRFIPPGKKNHQADVETVHDRIEEELFNLERFASRREFFQKTSAWQLWWNTTRTNRYKAGRTPDQILLETRPQRDPKLWLLPALDLDALLAKKTDPKTLNKSPTGGYYVPALPDSPQMELSDSRRSKTYSLSSHSRINPLIAV
jgi:transposase-like protein